ncbi:MAG: hypothetical protein LBR52_05485 [Prevotellaceae bacterium]|nr:hypothetical protein [Prevotellaceae bacterium]
MEDFKIKLFKEEYKKDFPLYIHLSKKECLIIVEKLLDMYNLPDIDTMIAYLCTNEKFFSNIEVENEFKLTEVLGCLSIEALENVYINWYKFDDIDIVKLQDLNKYFFDIWYPGSDDIDIFDESLSWVISVRHDGSVSYLKV